MTGMSKEWFRRAVVYHILIDRFAGYSADRAGEPVFCGGNLRGVIDKLPYLLDLGMDALYLSPHCAGTEYHGYHITDLYEVEPRFGNEADFIELARRVHEAGLKLIIDFVPNHVSRRHPYFEEALADRRSPYRPWFYFRGRPGAYRTFLDVPDLPKLNLDFPPARDHVIGAALRWLAAGADGLRVDHAVGLSRRFVRALRRAVAAVFPDAVIFAEAWFPHPPLRLLPTVNIRCKYPRFVTRAITQERLQTDSVPDWDGALDFAARDLFLRHLAHASDSPAGEAALGAVLARHYRRYPASFFLPSFLDNHDTNRFYFECGHDRQKLLRALELLLDLPQPVILYYGTESGLSQEKPLSPAVPYADLEARRLMNWETPDRELVASVKALIRRRRETR
jgi:cyclomaltodextrinase